MPPVMRPDAPDSSQLGRPHLVVQLEPGWSYDATHRAFVSADGRKVSPRGDLPKGSRILPAAPTLAGRPAASLSAAEEDLARYIQIVLPAGEDPAAYRAAVAGWECVADVQLPPKVSLPGRF